MLRTDNHVYKVDDTVVIFYFLLEISVSEWMKKNGLIAKTLI